MNVQKCKDMRQNQSQSEIVHMKDDENVNDVMMKCKISRELIAQLLKCREVREFPKGPARFTIAINARAFATTD